MSSQVWDPERPANLEFQGAEVPELSISAPGSFLEDGPSGLPLATSARPGGLPPRPSRKPVWAGRRGEPASPPHTSPQWNVILVPKRWAPPLPHLIIVPLRSRELLALTSPPPQHPFPGLACPACPQPRPGPTQAALGSTQTSEEPRLRVSVCCCQACPAAVYPPPPGNGGDKVTACLPTFWLVFQGLCFTSLCPLPGGFLLLLARCTGAARWESSACVPLSEAL